MKGKFRYMKKIELDFGVIKKLKKYIKKYYILIILNLLLATISSLVSSAPIALIKRLFDKGIAGKSEKDILYAGRGNDNACGSWSSTYVLEYNFFNCNFIFYL